MVQPSAIKTGWREFPLKFQGNEGGGIFLKLSHARFRCRCENFLVLLQTTTSFKGLAPLLGRNTGSNKNSSSNQRLPNFLSAYDVSDYTPRPK